MLDKRLAMMVSSCTYLSNPDGTSTGHGADLVDVVLKVMLVRGAAVPVHGDKVNVAAAALVQEALQPVEAGGGDGRGAELRVAAEGLHVLTPGVDGVADRQVRLVGAVGLVEGEQVAAAAIVEPVVGIVEPLVGVVALRAPEHRHVLGKVLLLVRRAVPVVLPVDLGLVAQPAAAKLPDRDVVVGGEAALRPRVRGGLAGEQGAGDNRSNEREHFAKGFCFCRAVKECRRPR